ERGIPVAPLYEWTVRLYYEDGEFRWRFESLGLVLRDPRHRWLDETDLVVFAEGSDGAFFAFEGARVTRIDPVTHAAAPFAPTFDAFLARMLAAAGPTGAREEVLAALGKGASFLA